MKRILHWFIAFTVVRVCRCNVRLASELSSQHPGRHLGGGISALFFVTLPLSPPAQAWRVECNMWHLQFSMALLLSHYARKLLCCHGGPLLERRAASPSASIFSPRDTALPLSIVHSPNLPARVLQRGLTAIFVPPTSTSWEHEALRIPAATAHWMVGEWVQLSGLMDDLSDFIWAGRTLRWLRPADCHFWLLYQGLTYRAVILLEWGSQALQPFPPPVIQGARPMNWGQIGQQTALIRLTLTFDLWASGCEMTWRPDGTLPACFVLEGSLRKGAYHVTAVEFLPYSRCDEPLGSPRWGQVNQGPLAHGHVYFETKLLLCNCLEGKWFSVFLLTHSGC